VASIVDVERSIGCSVGEQGRKERTEGLRFHPIIRLVQSRISVHEELSEFMELLLLFC
jgi:hypothetical protein